MVNKDYSLDSKLLKNRGRILDFQSNTFTTRKRVYPLEWGFSIDAQEKYILEYSKNTHSNLLQHFTYICRSYSYYMLATSCETLYAPIHSSYSVRRYNSDSAIKKIFSLICTSIGCTDTVMTTQKIVKSDEPIDNLQHGR